MNTKSKNSWINRVSIQWIIMMFPVFSFVLVLLAVGIIFSLQQQAQLDSEQLIDAEYAKADRFSEIGNALNNNHLDLYEHLRVSRQVDDEGEFYDRGKRLLLVIYDQEAAARQLTQNNNHGDELQQKLLAFHRGIVEYRNKVASALLMIPTSKERAGDIIDSSNANFNELNAYIHEVSQLMHEEVDSNVTAVHARNTRNISVVLILTGVVIALLMILSAFISRKISTSLKQHVSMLHDSLVDTNGLAEPKIAGNELSVLNRAVDRVKDNIDRLNRAKNKISRQEDEQRAIIESMIDAVIVIDEDGIVRTYNRAAEKMFGYASADVIGNNISMLMPEHHMHMHNNFIKRYVKSGVGRVIGTGRELIGLKATGESFPIRVNVSELPERRDGKQYFIGTCQDITLLKQQEEQLRRGMKMDALGKLTGGIAHDFNNLLGVILGITELIQLKSTDTAGIQRYNQKIQAAANRGAELTRKLLSFTRQVSENVGVVDINTILEDDRAMLEKTLTARITLTYDLKQDLWPVQLDSGDLADAIINICINASHAIERNGEIVIRTANATIYDEDASILGIETGDFVVLSISDDGCGMDEATREKVFDPFFSTKGEMGTGLGLSQVYGFVKRSRGIIKVYSEPERGSRFSMYFPRHIVESAIIKNRFVNEIAILSGDESILVVDDEQMLLDYVTELLTVNGYHVYPASDAETAQQILQREHIDLIITDVIMPGIDGYQLAAKVKEYWPDVKIQLASGFHDVEDESTVPSELRERLLHKPYNSKELLARVRALLDGAAD